MKLSSFIASNREQILEMWEDDARRRLPVAKSKDVGSLRDHLGELLDAVAADLDAATHAPLSPGEEAHTPSTWSHVEALAEKHGADRAQEGVTLNDTVPEFPILRTCVSRLWRQSLTPVTTDDLDDLIRFDEAIDLALTQSVSEFTDRLNRSRETFLGILGHDLRNPLSTIITGAKLMTEEDFDESKRRMIAGRVVSTAERMHQLVVDLLEFTRARLGGQFPIRPHHSDLAPVVQNLADEFRTLHPKSDVRLNVSGDLNGNWDDKRVSQAIQNILANAMHHGDVNRPVDISASANDVEVAIAVRNEGPPIPEETRKHLFEPLATESAGDKTLRRPPHLALGLYIAKTIVSGHGGHVEVESNAERGTTFTLHLPKAGAPEVMAGR